MAVVDIMSLLEDSSIQVKVGVDKMGKDVYLGDTIYQDVEEWFSPDYYNGYERNTRRIQPSEKVLHKGRVYRKVCFTNAQFNLERTRIEGSVPQLTSASTPAIQNRLSEYIKAD